MGCLYDHNYLAEGAHPDKKVLDRASDVHPILISHASGHMGVANSLMLKLANVNEETPEIEGGVIARYPGTKEPTGYLEENALLSLGRTYRFDFSVSHQNRLGIILFSFHSDYVAVEIQCFHHHSLRFHYRLQQKTARKYRASIKEKD